MPESSLSLRFTSPPTPAWENRTLMLYLQDMFQSFAPSAYRILFSI